MGIGTSNGWYFHPKHETLRRLFWNTFSTEVGQVSEQQHTAMGVARVVGLLLAYGYNDGDPVKEGDSLDATFRLRHLEAFLSV